jgi:hypothetical protein
MARELRSADLRPIAWRQAILNGVEQGIAAGDPKHHSFSGKGAQALGYGRDAAPGDNPIS